MNSETMNRCGVLHVASAVDEHIATSVCKEIALQLDLKMGLPGKVHDDRHFISVSLKSEIVPEQLHQANFRVPLSPCLLALLQNVGAGPCGDVLKECLGKDFHITECTAIIR
mmetsp:Transcript_12497/g.25514  ORF Transcript_12497/g.25514 Transcript_12497/m.25514 type:complete len:112 (+) Transcript_12497:182-517(+)